MPDDMHIDDVVTTRRPAEASHRASSVHVVRRRRHAASREERTEPRLPRSPAPHLGNDLGNHVHLQPTV
ncbi:hypothetical protein [Nocardioides sp. zg-1230]|uniref:hypothetical protein n=1 Tax=Nocardioides sp. zg-1230 TaxID=2736601 RepID=UPI0015546107|nr:hypothetical protein [Nocardioides sp. zg-1230]NPC41032.1 hypothetical protein [Nocardioides sp. zg-1230]